MTDRSADKEKRTGAAELVQAMGFFFCMLDITAGLDPPFDQVSILVIIFPGG